MQIQQHYSLKALNTFGLEAHASSFVRVTSVAELQSVLKNWEGKIFLLGGGSNILLTQDIDALVIKNEIREKTILREYKNCVHLAVGAGENWHQLVLWAIEQGLGGIENLSLIPGTVGAAPIQNIGAYGVELKDVFVRLEAVELATGKPEIFYHKDCQFGYRDSIFKGSAKGRYGITRVILRLSKFPVLNTSYGAIRDILAARGIKQPGIREVSEAVIQIRSSKLPDPAQLGNSGSFFKNPEISRTQFRALQERFPKIVHYPLPNGKVKIPAGWLIEQCGWKGKRVGNTGCHAQQALVLVNYGGASGTEVWAHAQKVMASVAEKFGIHLQAEVNII